MDPFLIYLLKCGGIATLFFGVYTLLLKQETFFEHNRYFLLTGIAASLLMPLLIFTKTIYIMQPEVSIAAVDNGAAGTLLPDTGTNWPVIFLYMYVLGVGLLLGRFIIQLLSLLQLISKSKIVKDGSFRMVMTREEVAPFSFFNYIVFHPESYNNEELHTIIEHEKIHASQWHSIDILLTHLFTIFLWVYPPVWMYKNSISQNLEYIADGKAVRKVSCIKKYQYLLLNTSAKTYKMALANNFFNSLIKKRIVMLNRNKSQQRNMWKYGIILPLLGAFLLLFNVKTVAQIKVIKKGKNHDSEMIHFSVHKNTTDDELKALKKEIKNENGDLSYKKLKRNSNGEITAITIEFRNGEDGYVTGSYNGGDEGIQTIVFGNNGKGGVFINSGRDHDSEHSFSSHSDRRIHIRAHSDDDDDDDDDNDDDDDDDDDDEIIIIGERDANGKGGKRKVRKIKRKGSSDNDVLIKVNSDDDSSPIFIVNGKVSSKKDIENLDTDDIGEVKVIKGNAAIEKYGKKAKDGVVKITSKSGKKSYKIKKKHKGGEHEKSLVLSTDGDANPLFIIDGKESSKKKVERLDTDNIEKIEVIKGDAAIEKYGKNAKDGVVKITTKSGE